MKKKVLVIDIFNMFIRNFSSLPFVNDNGEHVGGILGSIQSMISVVDKFKPDMVYVAWEGKNSSERRRKTLKKYKEGRKFIGFNRHFETSEEDERESFKRQIILLKSIFDEFPIYQGQIEYLEADDVIAYLCTKLLKDEEYNKIIVSTDRDYWQLLGGNIICFRPIKAGKYPKNELVFCQKNDDKSASIITQDFDSKKEKSKVNVHPSNYILIKCFGEKTDNIDGIRGIGEKTVLKDFPFIVSLKESGDIYGIIDLIEYAKEQVKKGNNRYSKYISEENQALLIRNEKLIQLLEPDISLASVKSIESSLTASVPKLNLFKLRIKLKKEGIAPKRLDKWIETLQRLKPEKINL